MVMGEQLLAAKEIVLDSILKEALETILDSAYEGILIVNQKGVITMCNKAYADFINARPEDVIGKNIEEIIWGSSFKDVLQTGKPELNHTLKINGNEVIASCIPIKKDEKTVGAVGKIIVKDIGELNVLTQKINLLRNKLNYYQEEVVRYRGAKWSLSNIIGVSHSISQIKETVKRVSGSDSTVLIRGEKGTGKELFAHALHHESPRRYGPFIKVNCAAVSEKMLEEELFGFTESPFNSRKRSGQIGKFELADQGTLFLDKIDEMPLSTQTKILELLQKKEIFKLDGTNPVKVDVRIVASTDRNLEELIKVGQFREDLYYRLNVLSLNIPPLRDRQEDIEPLVNYFIEQFNHDFGQKVKGISSDVLSLMLKYHWPGNIRELKNVLERAFNVLEGDMIFIHHLPMYLQKFAPTSYLTTKRRPLKKILEETEKAALSQALLSVNGNKVLAAKVLGISRAGLYQKLVKHNIRDE